MSYGEIQGLKLFVSEQEQSRAWVEQTERKLKQAAVDIETVQNQV